MILTQINCHFQVNMVRNFVQVKFAGVCVLQNFVVVLGQGTMNLNFRWTYFGTKHFTSLDLFNITELFAYRDLIHFFIRQIVLEPIAREGFALNLAQNLISQSTLSAGL